MRGTGLRRPLPTTPVAPVKRRCVVCDTRGDNVRNCMDCGHGPMCFTCWSDEDNHPPTQR
jgi:hypothetical protein